MTFTLSGALLTLLVFLPIASAPVCAYAARGNRRGFYAVSAVCAVECAAAVGAAAMAGSANICGLSFESGGFHGLYAVVAAYAFLTSAVFSVEYFAHYINHARYAFFYMLTFGAVEGVFLSADLGTTFVFFEIVSFASFVWVLHDESDGAISAAKTYLAVAVFGGMALLGGLLLLYSKYGTLSLTDPAPSDPLPYLTGSLLLVGFGAKAGMFPLHIWLPKAHPVAPAPASAILSGVLTKVGVYGIIAVTVRFYSGDAVWGAALMTIGCITLLLGAFLALLSADIKRTLACSSMSQIGFIMTGIAAVSILGEGGAMAAAGVVLYMLNHTMMKLILFSIAGVVHMDLHKLDLNSIRGWGRGRWGMAALFAWGGAGLAGVPGTCGYIAKTLIHEAITESAESVPLAGVVEWLFLFGGGCTLAYMIKLFVVLFVEKPEIAHEKRRAGAFTAAALTMAALPTAAAGVPALAGRIASLGWEFAGAPAGSRFHDVGFFRWGCLSGAVITASIGIAVYFLFVRTATRKRGEYRDPLPAWADLERSVYVPAIKALTRAGGAAARLFGENVVTSRVCKYGFAAAKTVCAAASSALDAAVYALRSTVLRASDGKNVRRPRRRFPILHAIYRERRTDNFSYSLIITALGVCVILIFIFIAPYV